MKISLLYFVKCEIVRYFAVYYMVSIKTSLFFAETNSDIIGHYLCVLIISEEIVDN